MELGSGTGQGAMSGEVEMAFQNDENNNETVYEES